MDYYDPQFQEFLLAGETQYFWYMKQRLKLPTKDLPKTLDLLENTVGVLNKETDDYFRVQLHHQEGEPTSAIWLLYSVRAPTRKAAWVLSYGLTASLEIDIMHTEEVEIVRVTTITSA